MFEIVKQKIGKNRSTGLKAHDNRRERNDMEQFHEQQRYD